MANTFIHRHALLTTSLADLYVPSGVVAIIFSFQVCNIDGANSADVTIETELASASDTYMDVLSTVPVPPDTTLNFPGKLVLEDGEAIRGKASAANDLEVTLAILEIS